jgi:hypothetical protein
MESTRILNLLLIKSIYQIVNEWKAHWPDKIPILSITEFMGQYIIYDTRAVAVTKHTLFDKQVAEEIMRVQNYSGSASQEIALVNKWAIVIDSKYIPLITAQRELMLQFEQVSDS